jgi:lipopolysaccharide cholinephosphotransferase
VCSRTAALKLKGIPDVDNLGPFVDIFILDKTSEDPAERAAQNKEVRALNRTITYMLPARYYRTLPPKRRMKMLFNLPMRMSAGLLGGFKKVRRERDEIMQRYRGSDSGLYKATYIANWEKSYYYKDEIEDLVLTDFEDIKVYIPAAYDKILTRIYGDYMQLPPKEQRVTHHHFVPVWN